jgi:multidrug efflux pump subunit AcrA (membrane-fusion protein)
MTAVATILGGGAEDSWLVPSNALVEFEGETTVRVVRNGREERIAVAPSSRQGEWTVVQSTELQAGDQVVGQVTSPLNEQGNQGGGPRGFFGGPPPR